MSAIESETTERELEQRLADAQQAVAERRRAAEDAIRRRELEERIRLVELEAEHGPLGFDIRAVFSPRSGRMIVVKTPKAAAFQRFQDRSNDSRKPLTTADLWDLVRTCRVYPEQRELSEIIEEAPGLLAVVANAAAELAGALVEGEKGK